MKGYILSPAARADLRNIWIFTEGRWDADQADSYIRDIVASCEALVSGARRGRSLGFVRRGYLRLNLRSHVICFRIVEEKIDVIRVLHGRMDIPARLADDDE